jgi:hypothetical protein
VITQKYAYLGEITGDEADPPAEDRQVELWEDAHEQLLREIESTGSRVGVMFDVPWLPEEPLRCLSRERAVAPCESTRDEALRETQPLRDADHEVTERVGVATFDPVEVLCNRSVCMLELDGALTFLDQGHVSNSATHSMRPQLHALLDQLVPV